MTMLRPIRRSARRAGLALALLFATALPLSAAALFTEVPGDAARLGYPESSRFFEMDLADMRAALAAAPFESFPSRSAGLTITLPIPEGTSEQFTIWETPVMHPDLAAKYPEIKTYAGRGIDDRTATIRLDTTPHGFHAMILSTRPIMFIDPVEAGNPRSYVSHYKRTGPSDPRSEQFTCELISTPETEREIENAVRTLQQQSPTATNGTELRTYRTAIACTGEYANYHGGTVPLALAAIVTSLNRVTGVYEIEVSLRMQLIPNNDLIVYTNAATDPYTNNNGGAMLGQNQANLDAVIGSANYDIGHAFSTGAGGIASLGCVCRTNLKARGVTGRLSPEGDAFDIDYVAHEMGHQFGGSHTFNGDAGSCGGNRSAGSAYEPGSGTTIMSYAGICAPQNILLHSTPEFHGHSFDQIVGYTQHGLGNGCPVITATGNNPPIAVAGNAGLTIPIDTPFQVFGSATDADGHPILYSWEEFDLGPAGHPDMPSGNAPIFRSFPPTDRVWRMFPRRIDVRNNTHTMGELLPSYTRTINLRLTARDNLGGVGNSSTTLTVEGTAGPFLVTSVDATPWNGGESKTITWDVAGTDLAPVSAPFVNIVLSTDDGVEFPTTLVANTPNDGSESILAPNISTSTARVKVEPVGNVFFDMNNEPFEIIAVTTDAAVVATKNELSIGVQPNPFTERMTVSFALARSGRVALNVYDAVGRHVSTLFQGERNAGPHTVDWNGHDKSGAAAAPGVYFIRLESENEIRTARALLVR